MTSMILASNPYVRKGSLAKRSLWYLSAIPYSSSARRTCAFHNISPIKSRGKVNNSMGRIGPNFFSGIHHAARFSTTLTMDAKNTFHIGDEVKTDVNGSLLNGKVMERKGGWYTVHVVENGKEGVEVKRRASKMSLLQSDTFTSGTRSTIDATPSSVELYGDQFPSSQEPIPMTPDSMAIINLDEAVNNQINEADVITNKKDRRNLEQYLHFSEFNKWVVFTDLHCSPSSLSTCLSILSVVHETAKVRDAGVLFLGDFWHHRGTIRVDCLNAVLDALSDWEVPMIMIPGNHDQVTLGGTEHSLTPLQNAYHLSASPKNAGGAIRNIPGILIFSEPTKFLDALFVPHIRDIGSMQSILQSKISASSSGIFVHADVTGAYMNDLITSTHGVAPAYFPPGVPIYSGHFHKPHTVKQPKAAPGVNIRYVGSPYETSLAEAGQEKSLLVLDSDQNWECMEEIPLIMGRKHWRITDIDEFIKLPLPGDHTNVNDENSVAPGDRVVIFVGQEELEEFKQKERVNGDKIISSFDAKVKLLRSQGSAVEIREMKSVPSSPITSLDQELNDSDDLANLFVEDLGPATIWSKFLQKQVIRDVMTDEKAETLNDIGSEIINDIEGDIDMSYATTLKGSDSGLSLEMMTVEGYGPFKDLISYPLKDRGLVLLKGTNRDGESQSNGTGKSSLAMSALWCLTGSTDPRPMQDGKVSDVINDLSKAARVTIRGSMNEISFAISRGKSSSKGSLTFVYDDEDLTRQSVKETQVLIEEKLGVGSQILSRTVFHGQHAMNGLLEATDAKLKDELGSIVALSVWQQAAQKARSKTRSYSKQLSELDGMLSIRQKDLDILSEKSLDAGRIVREMEQTLEDQRGGDQADIKVQLHKASHNPNMESLQMELNVYTEQVRSLENELDKTQVACEQALKEMRNHAMEKKSEYDNARSKRLLIQQQIKRLENDLTSANKHLDSLNGKWQTEHTNMEHSTELLVIEECPTCGQSINDEHSLKNVRLEITDSINSAVRNVEDIAGSLSIEKRNAEIDASKFHQLELELSDLSDILKVNERDWEMQISDIRHQIFEERRKHSKCLTALAEAAKVMEGRMERAKYDANLSLKIKRFEDKIEAARESQRALSCDVTEMENTLNDLAVKRGDIERQCALMTSVSDNFGVRGVQTYILQNAVHALRVASQCYLDELSDGSLHLSLDLDSNDRILRTASVRTPNGSLSRRPLSSLSGGQWRRCSLALSLGFADILARRGHVRSSLLVLDEPLTHLDSSGRDNVGKLLRKLLLKTDKNDQLGLGGFSPVTTILVILQDLVADELSESFDCIDHVVKLDGKSHVIVDELA